MKRAPAVPRVAVRRLTVGSEGRPRVLLLDEAWPATHYLAEGLSRAGCEVQVLSSAHIDGRFLGNRVARSYGPAPGDPDYARRVADVAAKFRPAAILPLTDDLVRRSWEADPSWSSLVIPPTAPWQRELLSDKLAMSEFLRSRGVRTPRSVSVGSPEELPAALAAVGLPAVVKGVVGFGGVQVRIVADEAEAQHTWARLRSACGRPPFLQQHVAGVSCLAGGLLRSGRMIRLYAAERLEQYPPRTGPSIRVRSHRDARLIDAVQDVFRHLDWTGISSADFIRGTDGDYYFLEVNPRPWGSIYSAEAAGVDIYGPMAAMLRGEEPEPVLDFRHGVITTMFPDHIQARLRGGGLRALGRAGLDVVGWLGVPWWRPGLAAHLTLDLYRAWRQETRAPGSVIAAPTSGVDDTISAGIGRGEGRRSS